jgi:hypothetical protein
MLSNFVAAVEHDKVRGPEVMTSAYTGAQVLLGGDDCTGPAY